ncbi:EGF-like domain-containing protein [Cedratvirus lausannensis]|uniref:EGF-like domain-containing protein n=1 Tax=Cedratvirus lausannensis TaxID=2023205 RepID=A0A285PXU2_9VIRU|nr:EGF-like domain-containing protein [Cedratvirus lausannensis]
MLQPTLWFLLVLVSTVASSQHEHPVSDNPELVTAEVFYPNGSFVVVSINTTKIQTDYNNVPCPGVDLQELRQARLVALKEWVERTNQDMEYILSVYDKRATPDIVDGKISEFLHVFSVPGFGAFSALKVAAEYSVLAADPNGIHLFMYLDPTSIVWRDDGITVDYNVIINYTFPLLGFSLDGFVSEQTAVYPPCSDKIWVDASLQDPLVVRFLGSRSGAYSKEENCLDIMRFCTGPNQVYATYDDCISYMTGVEQKPHPCPGGYIANDSVCYNFHKKSAEYLPEVHCPHVSPTSSVCRDFCLVRGCGNCHANAECILTTKPGELLSSYACKCKEGYIGDGQTCTKATCTGAWNCPTSYNFATCVNSTCGCKKAGGFLWDGSKSDVCSCGRNEKVYYVNGEPECMPLGRCRELWQCPQKYNTVSCSTYGTNALLPFKTCLCNYGYDNLGFARDCQCSAPKREIWSPSKNGFVCLRPDECSEGYHCSSGKTCQKAPSSWLGTCV